MDLKVSIHFRRATLADAEKAARLHVLEKDLSWQTLLPVFTKEFSICDQSPDLRIYDLALVGDNIIGYAGARHFDNETDENMYETENPLPTGWYLRGIKVHPDWRRLGLAKQLTLQRLSWLSQRSNKIYVFLDDANKPSLAMYHELGFRELSRGWTFTNPARRVNGNNGLLLLKTI